LKKIKYKARKGSRISDKQAEIYGKCIQQLINKYNGRVTTNQIVEDAEDIISPLHDFFKWDNTEAAELYRKHQARLLKNSIVEVWIVEKNKNKKEYTVASFVNVKEKIEDSEETEQCYVTLERTLSERDFRNQTISKLLLHLEHMQIFLRLLQDYD